MDCHDVDTEKGGFNLEDLSFTMDNVKTADRWSHVLDTLNSGEMPPKDKKQMPNDVKISLLSDLSTALVTARKALSDSGGKSAMRLNRREYQNMESLFGIPVVADELPDDQSASGFDTTGASLFFSA